MYKKKTLDKNNIQKVRFNSRDLGELLASLGLATTGFDRSIKMFETYL